MKDQPSQTADKTAPGYKQATDLLDHARVAARHAYAPYSHFAVGAAVETSDGTVFTSANMENASYGVTVCAEVGAIQAASAAGMLGQIRRIAIVGGPIKADASYQPKPTAPCGRCRQLIAEAASLGGCDIEVWYSDLQDNVRRHLTISELLPDAFDASDMR